jgi:hypothetical protein
MPLVWRLVLTATLGGLVLNSLTTVSISVIQPLHTIGQDIDKYIIAENTMPQIYTVEAYSPSTGQSVRQFDLTNVVNEQLTQEQANFLAERFAELQNRNFYLRACDWQPVVKYQSVGVATIDGYQWHTGTQA